MDFNRILTPIFLSVLLTGLAAQTPLATRLESGESEQARAERMKAKDSAQNSFELGVLEAVRSAEILWQTCDALGAGKTVPVLALTGKYFPLARRKVPEPCSYAKITKALADFSAGARKSAAYFLAGGSGTWKTALTPGKTRIDFNADGKRSREETVATFMQWATHAEPGSENPLYDSSVSFDASDSLLLSGMFSAVSAFIDLSLAYDLAPVYRAYGRIVFPFPSDIPLPAKTETAKAPPDPIRLKPLKPDAGPAVRNALLSALTVLKKALSAIEQENDDTAEWVGNASQSSARIARVSDSSMSAYGRFLDAAMDALAGKTLVPIEGSQKGFDLHAFLSALPVLGDGIALPALARMPAASKPMANRDSLPALAGEWFESTF